MNKSNQKKKIVYNKTKYKIKRRMTKIKKSINNAYNKTKYKIKRRITKRKKTKTEKIFNKIIII